MKKIMPLLLIALTYVIYAQDFDPKQQKFVIMNDSVHINSQNPLFKLRGFMLGVQWGATSRKISSSLLIKQVDGRRPETSDELQDSCDMFLPLDGQSHNMGEDFYNVRAMVFEPTLLIDSLKPYKLIKRQGDTTHQIFGFQYRRGEVSTNPIDPNFNRLILRDTFKNQLVLSKPWPDNELNMFGYTHHYSGLPEDEAVCDSFLCRTMYLSINMRCLDNNYPNDTLLIIEAPYKIANSDSVGLISFSMLPSPNTADTSSFPDGRGKYRNMLPVSVLSKKIIITRSMLPEAGNDITISASFTLWKNSAFTYLSNPILPHDHDYVSDPISNLGINVTYVGRAPVAIDWIKFETPHARAYLSGQYDDIIKHNVQVLMLLYASPITQQWLARGIRPFRFVPIVEGGICHWASQRYFHKLVGDVTTKEEGSKYPEHYEYYVDPPDRWFDIGASRRAHMANPYCKKYYESYDNICRTMRLGSGYMGLVGINPVYVDSLQDTLYQRFEVKNNYKSADYETMVPIYQNNLLKPTYFFDHPDDLNTYIRAMNDQDNGWAISPMMWLERMGYGAYNNKAHSGFLYSEKPWWAHFFLMTAYFDVPINEPPLNLIRQKTLAFDVITSFFTPEEYKASAWMALIRGTKGLIYDGVETDSSNKNKQQFYDGNCIDSITKYSLERLPDEEFLLSDIGGPDYFRVENEINDINQRAWFLDTMAIFFERPKEKIYFGRKSMRWEVYKLHKYIRQVEPTLMNLKLEAHFMKGYRMWYSQHPKYDTSTYILNDFLLYPEVKTQNPDSANYENFGESYYDVSLLSDPTVDSTMKKVFYLGVLNRRTNPLIMEDDTLQFYPTYEWDRNVWTGGEQLWGDFKDTTYWRDNYWKRMGVRQISLPMFYVHDGINFSTKLRVMELGAQDSAVNSWKWRRPEYYNTIDTVVDGTGDIIGKFLPGEGKILKVTPVTFAYSPIDTCQGCDALNKHIEVDVSPVRCEGGFNKWTIAITNNSDCIYNNLSLIIKSSDNNAQYLDIDTKGSGYNLKQDEAEGKRVWILTGQLNNNSQVNLPFAISSNYSVNYQITWGEIVDGKLVECNEALVSAHSVESDCDKMQADIKDTTLACQCGTAKVIHVWIPDSLACVSELVFNREVNGAPVSDTLTAVADSGYTFTFCPWENWRASVTVLTQTGVRCTKEFSSPCSGCDSVKVTYVPDILAPICQSKYRIDFTRLSGCATTYDLKEVIPGGGLIPVSLNNTIPPASGGYVTVNVGAGNQCEKRFIIAVKNNDCSPICFSDTIKTRCPNNCPTSNDIRTKITLEHVADTCRGMVNGERYDTINTEIYGISIVDPREPDMLLYSEFRNPISDPPIDLRIPGGYPITTLVFPCDSALKLTVKYWDADTNCVAINDIDTTIGAGDNREYLESLTVVPNPASEEITLDYEMKKGADVELEITDSQGNTKRKSIKAYRGKGKHNLTFQLNGLQSGVYYAIIRAEDEAIATRIVILK